MTFNYKDLSFLRMAILAYVEKLSQIDEDDPNVGEDRFTEIQDDIEYLERLRGMVEREMAAIKGEVQVGERRFGVVREDAPEEGR